MPFFAKSRAQPSNARRVPTAALDDATDSLSSPFAARRRDVPPPVRPKGLDAGRPTDVRLSAAVATAAAAERFARISRTTMIRPGSGVVLLPTISTASAERCIYTITRCRHSDFRCYQLSAFSTGVVGVPSIQGVFVA